MKHFGFNVHRSDPVPPENKIELEKFPQYILRNPFSVEKVTMESPNDTIIYRSRLNPKINRNFEIHTPHGFPDCYHPTHPRQGRANGPLLRLIFEQDARPAPPRRKSNSQ